MKNFLIVFFVIAVAVHCNINSNNSQWHNFKKTYKKVYDTKEDLRRFQIFEDNLELIKKHNDLFDKKQVSFKLGINQFADFKSDEFRKTLSFAKNTKSNLREFVDIKLKDIPESLNWTALGAVTGVRTGGNCGSSDAYGITESYEGQKFIKTGNLNELSHQELIDCVYGECTVGLLESGYDYVNANGLSAAADYPKDSNGTCQRGSIPSAVTGYGFAEFTTTEAGLQQVCAQTGPLVVVVDARYWQLYTEGILSCDGSANINHVALVVGYGSDNGSDYWLLKNSWGSDWGENGYIRLARGQQQGDNCGITTIISYPLVE